ncbi:MAG: hypothetical protein JXR37_06925 [Kiritimatiellae bacterium]|nr:hypothetical protein [Kiritimatiellia bacterium]
MSDKPKCLMAVTKRVHDGFFTPALLDEAERLVDLKTTVVHKEARTEFEECVRSFRPPLVVTGWGSPPSPRASLKARIGASSC